MRKEMVGLLFFGTIAVLIASSFYMIKLAVRSENVRIRLCFLLFAALPFSEMILNHVCKKLVMYKYERVDEARIALSIKQRGFESSADLLHIPIKGINLPYVESFPDYFEAARRYLLPGKVDKIHTSVSVSNDLGVRGGFYYIEAMNRKCVSGEAGCVSENGVALIFTPSDHGFNTGSRWREFNCTEEDYFIYEFMVCDVVTSAHHGNLLLEYEKRLWFTYPFTLFILHTFHPVSNDMAGFGTVSLAKMNWITEKTESFDYEAFANEFEMINN